MQDFYVSVIIPVFDAEEYIDSCILSVVKHKEVREIICIDDKSTDGSLRKLREWQSKDSRIVVLENKGTQGCGPTRNVGIKYATCQFIAFIDADDFMSNDRFENDKIIFRRENNIDGVASSFRLFYEDSSMNDVVLGPTHLDTNISITDITSGTIISFIALTLRRETIEKIGFFDEKIYLSQDVDYLFELLTRANIHSSLSKNIVANYRKHSTNSTNEVNDVYFYNRMSSKKVFKKSLKISTSYRVRKYYFNKYQENFYLTHFREEGIVKRIIKSLILPFTIIHIFNNRSI